MLLKSGADANLAMADGRTPIHIASEAGNIGVIKLLLENEADILATDEVTTDWISGSDNLKLIVRSARLLYTRPAKLGTSMFSSACWTSPSSTIRRVSRPTLTPSMSRW